MTCLSIGRRFGAWGGFDLPPENQDLALSQITKVVHSSAPIPDFQICPLRPRNRVFVGFATQTAKIFGKILEKLSEKFWKKFQKFHKHFTNLLFHCYQRPVAAGGSGVPGVGAGFAGRVNSLATTGGVFLPRSPYRWGLLISHIH